jgi:hypothetical protein
MGRASRRRRNRNEESRIGRIDHPDGSKTLQINDPALVAQLSAEFAAQAACSREKFGRGPGPSDPIFFDPDADSPKPMPLVKIEAERVTAMDDAGRPPEFIYAFQQTGPIVTSENRLRLDAKELAEWGDAVDRYLRLHRRLESEPDELGELS